MKKIAIFFIIIIAIVSTVYYIYMNNIASNKIAQKENAKFEMYIDKEIIGSELATVINKAIDTNTKNEVEKNEQGKYVDNQKNSINIDVKFIEDEAKEKYLTYAMEIIYKVGTGNLLNIYRDSIFKCNEVQYHKETGKIKYMLFEQVAE